MACPLSLLERAVSLRDLLPLFELGLTMGMALRVGLLPCLGLAWQSGWLMLSKGATLMEKHLYSPTKEKVSSEHVLVRKGSGYNVFSKFTFIDQYMPGISS